MILSINLKDAKLTQYIIINIILQNKYNIRRLFTLLNINA